MQRCSGDSGVVTLRMSRLIEIHDMKVNDSLAFEVTYFQAKHVKRFSVLSYIVYLLQKTSFVYVTWFYSSGFEDIII